MAFDFRLPDLGEGISEGELHKWLVKEGDIVEEHQEIAEVETDKALVKLPSPKSGIILKIHAQIGTIKVGELLCTIGEKGEKISQVKITSQKSEREIKQEKPKKGSSTVIGELEEADEEIQSTPKKIEQINSTFTANALPFVRKLAKEMNVDIEKIKGTGKNAMITEDDVRKLSGSREKSSSVNISFEKFGRVIRVPLKGIRKSTAQNMTVSLQTAAHVTHMDFADVTELANFREKEKERADEKGVHLTFLPFVIKACALALKEFPYVNSSLDDEKQEIVLKQYCNIGFAVDTQNGLMVPVIHNVHEKTIIDLGRDIWKLSEKCRTREIEMSEMQGGTFTITNIGSLGGVFATPVINHPECAIIALGKIQDQIVLVNGKVETRKMLPLSLSFDHRIIDGAMAAKFVNEIKKHLLHHDVLLMGY